MFGGLGFGEIFLIFIIALIVFGPRKLPEIGKTLGKALNEFKNASEELKSTIEREVHVEEARSLAPAPPAAETVARAEPAPAVTEPVAETSAAAPTEAHPAE
jgi:TatA/E family protein of Tat protein translocase